MKKVWKEQGVSFHPRPFPSLSHISRQCSCSPSSYLKGHTRSHEYREYSHLISGTCSISQNYLDVSVRIRRATTSQSMWMHHSVTRSHVFATTRPWQWSANKGACWGQITGSRSSHSSGFKTNKKEEGAQPEATKGNGK